MKYSLLCSGSKGNCFVLESDQTRIVIDCGSTKAYLSQSFHTIGVDYTRVDALLLTHEHSDHIAQLKMFSTVPIYAPFQLKNYDLLPFAPYQNMNIRDLQVTSIPLSHDTDINVGYILSDRTHKVVYITDTGYVRERDFPYLRGADAYIFESNHDPELLMQSNRPYIVKQRILSDRGHMSNQASADVLASLITAKTQSIVLAHVSQEANNDELVYQTIHDRLLAYDQSVSIKVAKQFEIIQEVLHE